MSSGQGQEHELAELLKEVRELRKTLEQLKPTTARPHLPPDYAVLVRQASELPPDYAVAVRQVAVSPSYEVLVRQAIGEHEGDPPRIEQQ
jgi:hypothetical protein